MPFNNDDLKRAALAGARHERDRLDQLITQLERELGGRATRDGSAPSRKRHNMSAAGRKRIAEAARKRWAAVRAAAKKAAPGVKRARRKRTAKRAAAPTSTIT